MNLKRLMMTVVMSVFVMSIPMTAYAATNELTGNEVSDSIANQRPVAIIVDNEKTALPHYGVGEADIVYEMMNSTKNGRITRLMCLYKDWANLKQTGSIRSTRSTNVLISDEYNAVLIHDGGPFYIDTYLAQPYAAHISGGFSRIKNGKATEFTEYVFGNELVKRFGSAKLSTAYSYAPERNTHFLFNTTDVDLNSAVVANTVDMSNVFTHNKSMLKYNATTKTYDYYVYNNIHKDAEDSQVATFKNVILQNVTFAELDKNGYLIYNVIGEGSGYYITNGKAIPITWRKGSETGITKYYDAVGAEIKVNKGKTYVGILPSDTWSKLVIK
jgi:hypothetical protein